MIINLIKDYFILGLIVIAIGLITELATIKKFPKIETVAFLYLVWPLFLFWYIKFLCVYINFIYLFSKKYNQSYYKTFKELINDFPKTGTLF